MQPSSENPSRPLLVFVEGTNDIDFLRVLSAILHRDADWVPNLAELEIAGRLLFIPIGGSDFGAWAVRFAGFHCREFHLYDGEVSPERERRAEAIRLINARRGCRGFLTRKRSLENYLHPVAIAAAGGGTFEFDDLDCLGSQVAQRWYEAVPQLKSWSELTRRARQRFTYRAKRWLNREAVARMTVQLVHERDPTGEVSSWFRESAELLAIT